MTVNVLARVGSIGTDFAAGNYNVTVDIAATDGAGDYSYGILVQIPLSTLIGAFNNLIVSQVVAHVALQLSQTVLPGDVFFQFFDVG